MIFGCSLLESILASGSDFGRSKKLLFSVRITFKGTIKHNSAFVSEFEKVILKLKFYI